jgi:hypothetical protein
MTAEYFNIFQFAVKATPSEKLSTPQTTSIQLKNVPDS